MLTACLEYNECRILAYRECVLSLYDIAHITGRNPATITQIWNQIVAGSHNKFYVRSQCFSMTKAG